MSRAIRNNFFGSPPSPESVFACLSTLTGRMPNAKKGLKKSHECGAVRRPVVRNCFTLISRRRLSRSLPHFATAAPRSLALPLGPKFFTLSWHRVSRLTPQLLPRMSVQLFVFSTLGRRPWRSHAACSAPRGHLPFISVQLFSNTKACLNVHRRSLLSAAAHNRLAWA